ncbi:MAG: SH3 domain-containing protein [Cyanobacteria bacterium P01_A01_bin.83]
MTKSIFIKRLSATAQFILGFVLGISIIVGISGAAIFAYYKKMSVVPSKPVFSEPVVPESSADDTPVAEIEPLESNTTQDEVSEAPIAVEKSEPEPSAIESELPPNAYRAVVTWPQGLSLRAEPDLNAGRVGGIGADATIIILEDSADGNWQRVRLPWSGQSGWIKAGNTKRISY